MNIEAYGLHLETIPENEFGVPARITAVHRERYAFVSSIGEGFARLKTGAYFAGDEAVPTTGDYVMLDPNEMGESRILKTLPRKTFFERRDPSSSGHGGQAVAANFDYVFILQSLDGNFNPRRLERYLTLSWQSGAVPVVLLTKADAIGDVSAHQRAAEELAIGADVITISAKTGVGIDRLSGYLKPGKTIVFLGSSGVGKSTLINTLAANAIMKTKTVRGDGRGRHTTTHRELIMLKNGAMVIDTPGMRELGMWEVSEGLGKSFADVEQYFGLCKFSDCRHQSEPGCAVKAAIRRGELSGDHWESYQRLSAEAQYADDKTSYLRKKEAFFKDIAKFSRQLQKAGPADYRRNACLESFICMVCGEAVSPEGAGSQHRNHCPRCLSSRHVDNKPGDRTSLCKGEMDPIGVWVRNGGEWAVIHRCRSCGTLGSNRIAADDNPELLLSIAMKPLASPPFPESQMKQHLPAGVMQYSG